MPADPVTAVASALKELLEVIKVSMTSKRIRYSVAANKQALKYIRRVRLVAPSVAKGKTLRKIEKKFIDLTTGQ